MTNESILASIGNTPLVRLVNLERDFPCKVWAKVEAQNPGHSAKDRIAKYILDKALKEGRLKEGYTVIEATSGNTGYSIAMWCAVNRCRAVLTLSSKTSKEKRDLLKAMGVEIIVCPSGIPAEHPDSYYSKAMELSGKIPNSFYLRQNYNEENIEAHYHSTGKEIWAQTGGDIDYFICALGTGGTFCGTSKYLKEQDDKVRCIGVDAEGSVLSKYIKEGIYSPQEAYSYKIEGLGKTIIPATLKKEYIDDVVKVSDKASALKARLLAKTEGLLMGYSSGAVLQAAYKFRHHFSKQDNIVLLFSDHGSRYLSKIYNDKWMEEQRFFLKEDALASIG